MNKIKDYILRNFEQVLVLMILVPVILINYFIPYRIAFLNFYYLPIMVAGYLLGRKASVMGSLLCILLVTIFAILFPRSFSMEEGNLHIALSLATWGSFLLLAGIIVGTLHERLAKEYHYASQLNEELQKNQRKLEDTNLELKESNQILKEKTEELEEKKRTIETLKDKVENALYSTMDSTVAKLVVEERLRNEKKIISVLFSDLVGFTTFSDENRPETVIERLNKFL